MELRRYISIIWHWLWLILLGTLLAGGSAYGVSKWTTPIYQATATLLVNQATAQSLVTDYTSVLTSQQLAKTYSELIKKRPVAEAVIDHLKLVTTPELLNRQLSVNLVRDTMLVSLSYEDPNPQLAAAVVNNIANTFIEQTNALQHSRYASSEDNLAAQLKEIQATMKATQRSLDQARTAVPADSTEVARLQSLLGEYQNNYTSLVKSYEELRVTEARSIDSITVAEPAAVPTVPVHPQTLLNTLLAAVVGAMLAVGVAFLVEYLDDTVKTPDDVREALKLVTMGVIAHFEHKIDDPKTGLPIVNTPRSPIAEAFRSLRTNIQFASVDHKIRTLLVTSPNPGEGKTTVATNLAIALAQAGQSVALIDADLRRPSVHRWLTLANSGGLTNATLLENGKLNGYLQTTTIPGLKALPSGPLPPNPAELLGSERVAQILEQLKAEVDIAIVDSPPTLVVTDSAVLANRVDAVLLVLETGTTRRGEAHQALEGLQQVGANVIGVVLNKLSLKRNGYYHYKYYQYSYYYTSSGQKTKHKGKRKGSNHWDKAGITAEAKVAPMSPIEIMQEPAAERPAEN